MLPVAARTSATAKPLLAHYQLMTPSVIDVAVFTNVGVHSASIETLTTYPPLSVEVDLGQGVSIAPILPSIAKYVFGLCSPHHLKSEPVDPFNALYAFIRGDNTDESGLTWDKGEYIQTAIVLSRLAHPTSIGFEDSARLFLSADGKDVHEGVPGPIKGFGAHAFVTDQPSNWRNWLTKDDAVLTRRLMGAFYDSTAVRPPRVTRALWFHEYTARTHYLNLRWVLMVTGLEALINVDEKGSRQQFRTRTVGLASRCGISWTDEDAKVAYGLRSKLAHGQHVSSSKAEHHALYVRMETVLRAALREALLNADFGSIFADDNQIKAEWPLPSGGGES